MLDAVHYVLVITYSVSPALGDRRIAVGGAGLAAECMRGGLIDEFELVETRTFGGTVYLRYRRCG